MKKNSVTLSVIFIVVLLSIVSSPVFGQGQGNGENHFVMPEILKDNVAFWKKIYTEVSLKDGLLHDRDHPLIIYKKITIGNLRGSRRRAVLRKHMNQIRQSLYIINKYIKSPSRWGDKERKIYGMFKVNGALKDLRTARNRLRFQQGQKERFKEGLERSGAYLIYIRSVFAQYGIPQRIIYLPHVESSFNPKAYSRVGAAGMWQFMRRTGRLFMKIDYKIDERKDPYLSTVAAAKLLKHNYEAVKSWPLAITAYNHGLQSIQRAVRQTRTRDLGVIIQKYKNRRFRFASKNFYSCFLAASEIGANPEKYFTDINYHFPLKYNEIELTGYIRPDVLSKHLGISLEDLKRLNPSLRSTIFSRRLTIPRGFKLRIPPALPLEEAKQKMAAIPGNLKSTKSTDFMYYSVRRGDTLYRISRRFRVSTQTLLAANNIRRKNRIYIGQVLRIPSYKSSPPKKKQEQEKIRVTAPPPQPQPESKPEPKPESKPGSKPPPEPQPESNPGSKNEAVPVKNKIRAPGEEFDATLYSLAVIPYPKRGTVRIRVAVNETLGHYADWLGTPTYRIRNLNHYSRRGIQVNQKLWLPMKNNKLESFNAKRLEYHMALEEDFYSQYKVTGVTERRVRYGDTLWSICSGEEEIPLWLFLKYNRHIDIGKLSKGTEIRLPVIKNRE